MIRTFLHADADAPTTLSELLRLHQWAETTEFFGLYAYAVNSGAVAFDIKFGTTFWNDVPSRWLFGIDYARTQPKALRFMLERPNTEVRIYDGEWLVEREGFVPRRDFHMKTAFLLNEEEMRFGMVVGSGNFSSNGLRRSVECGASLRTTTVAEFDASLRPALDMARTVWDEATPADDIIDLYEDRWDAALQAVEEHEEHVPDYEQIELFWIEAGYITRNRGLNRPGNQVDMPRGMNRYFGYDAPQDLARNSVIGPITFEPPLGNRVTNNLRLGNNMMEKISLPIPETHGFDMYDGKVLVFAPKEGRFRMWALEPDDFDTAFKHRLAGVKMMASGRRYGHII